MQRFTNRVASRGARPLPASGRWSRALTAGALVLAVLAPPAVRAQLDAPTFSQRNVSQQIAMYLERVHIRQSALDDTVSKEFLRSFLGALDPLKLYFLASDVEEFRRDETRLDDWLKSGELALPWRIYAVYVERLRQRLAFVERTLAKELDFSIDDKLRKDRKEAPWASDEKSLDETWGRYLKYLVLQAIASGEDEQKAREQIVRRYQSLLKRMGQTNAWELAEIYLTAGTMLYDPHTTYMSPDTLESFEISMRLQLEGIGAALQWIDGYTVVSQVIPGGAAARDGRLLPQDKILRVGQGKDGELVDVVDMRLRDVVKLIRGDKGTLVQLELLHEENEKKELIVLERAEVKLTDREAHGEVIEVPRTAKDGGESATCRIGVIDLPSFYMDMAGARSGLNDFKSTTRDVRKILDRFREEKVEVVLVDLRENGGGALSESIDMTGLFIDRGPVVQIKDTRGFIEVEEDDDPGVAWDGPLVVLVSKYSASASEIFAGALQDYGRALIVGDTSTHGKGTVQRLLELGRGGTGEASKLGALKITVSQFYRPTGASTQNRGVVPDIILPSKRNHMEIGEATLEHAIEFDSVRRAEFPTLGAVSPELVRGLDEASKKRRSENAGFTELTRDIERYLAAKKREWISLEKSAFLKDYGTETSEADELPRVELVPPADGPPKIHRDYYLDEVLAITAEFATSSRT